MLEIGRRRAENRQGEFRRRRRRASPLVSKGCRLWRPTWRTIAKKSFEVVDRDAGEADGREVARQGDADPERACCASTYEHLVAQSTKVGEIVTDVAKESCKPFEGMLAKVGGK